MLTYLPRQPRAWSGSYAVMMVIVICTTFIAIPKAAAQDHPHPDPPGWVQDKVLYEVSLRHFSRAGNLAGFREQLPRLKELGVGVLWFMPVHPIGVERRSDGLGSPYAVKDYKAFNPEFGTLEEFKAVVKEAHDLGMYVILDWVANHTSPDHPWVREHPDWYTRDEAGRMIPPTPSWPDVVDLNYDAEELRRAMIDAMAFWVREADIDGYRCDTAEWLPLDFWVEARDALWEIKPVFMLGEGAKPELVEYAFDAAYAWSLTPNMHEIAQGKKTVTDLVNYLNAEARILPGNGFRLNFTTNHDINAWESTAVERMGPGLEAFTVLTFTVNGMPLIFNGQEARLDRQLDFFHKVPITWRDDPMADLYRALSELKHHNKALWHGNRGGPLQVFEAATNESVLTFQREADGNRVVVMFNLSDQPQRVPAPDLLEGLHMKIGDDVNLENGTITLPPWSYRVWSDTPR